MANSATTLEEQPAKADDASAVLAAPLPPTTVPSDNINRVDTPTTRRSHLPWIWLAALVVIALGVYAVWRHEKAPASGDASSAGAGRAGGGRAGGASASIPVVAATAH